MDGKLADVKVVREISRGDGLRHVEMSCGHKRYWPVDYPNGEVGTVIQCGECPRIPVTQDPSRP